jgi:hypothetical protein
VPYERAFSCEDIAPDKGGTGDARYRVSDPLVVEIIQGVNIFYRPRESTLERGSGAGRRPVARELGKSRRDGIEFMRRGRSQFAQVGDHPSDRTGKRKFEWTGIVGCFRENDRCAKIGVWRDSCGHCPNRALPASSCEDLAEAVRREFIPDLLRRKDNDACEAGFARLLDELRPGAEPPFGNDS